MSILLPVLVAGGLVYAVGLTLHDLWISPASPTTDTMASRVQQEAEEV